MYTEVVLPGGRKVRYDGCPASHITPDVMAWFDQYAWFDWTKQTPVQMGLLSIDELDPRWFEAMRAIRSEVMRRQAERLRAASRPVR
jgi:hypothetical protein